MIKKRILERLETYEKALGRLVEAVEVIGPNVLEKDGTVQRFEFTFEIAWKLLKDAVNYLGVEAVAPRMVIKEAFALGLVKDFYKWEEMLNFRNIVSHEYSNAKSEDAFEQIKDKFLDELKELVVVIKKGKWNLD
jgi:nucleotidyltransferase substrate binding protein (TIGR01987 family)